MKKSSFVIIAILVLLVIGGIILYQTNKSSVNSPTSKKLVNSNTPQATFSTLYNSSVKFLSGNNDPSKLLPQYLEEHGYLDKSFGYGTGSAANWTKNGGWIGLQTCPDKQGVCFGVGLSGNINNLKPIIEKYKSKALQVFFPYPKVYDENSKDTNGQLLMIFRAPTSKNSTNSETPKVALSIFSTFYNSSVTFFSKGNDPLKLVPQYLEEYGYLDKSFGYEAGPAVNWTKTTDG